MTGKTNAQVGGGTSIPSTYRIRITNNTSDELQASYVPATGSDWMLYLHGIGDVAEIDVVRGTALVLRAYTINTIYYPDESTPTVSIMDDKNCYTQYAALPTDEIYLNGGSIDVT